MRQLRWAVVGKIKTRGWKSVRSISSCQDYWYSPRFCLQHFHHDYSQTTLFSTDWWKLIQGGLTASFLRISPGTDRLETVDDVMSHICCHVIMWQSQTASLALVSDQPPRGQSTVFFTEEWCALTLAPNMGWVEDCVGMLHRVVQGASFFSMSLGFWPLAIENRTPLTPLSLPCMDASLAKYSRSFLAIIRLRLEANKYIQRTKTPWKEM